jgi:hypothetical protein
MKFSLKILALVIIAASTFSLISCAGPAGFSYQNVSITISGVECSDCPGIFWNPAYPVPGGSVYGGGGTGQGGGSSLDVPGSVLLQTNQSEGSTTLFTAQVINAPANITWAIYPTPNIGIPNPVPTGTGYPVGESGNAYGSLAVVSGTTVIYTAPGPPVFSGAALVQAEAMGIPQGDVMLVGTVPSNPAVPSQVATVTQLIQIFNGASSTGPPTLYLNPATPTNPSGLTDSVVTVPHGTSFQFYGGVVGAPPCTTAAACANISATAPMYTTDNTPIWSVGFVVSGTYPGNAVAGGSTAEGTITQTGLYTAPATVPAAQPVIVLSAHISTSTTKTAYITVN